MIFDINTLISTTIKKKAEQKLRVIEYKRLLKRIKQLGEKASIDKELELEKLVFENDIRVKGNEIINLRLATTYSKNVLKEELKIAKLCLNSLVNLEDYELNSMFYEPQFKADHPNLTDAEINELHSLYVCGVTLNKTIFNFPQIITYHDKGILFHKGFDSIRMEYMTEEHTSCFEEYMDIQVAYEYIDNIFGKYTYASNYIKSLSENIFVYTDEYKKLHIVFVAYMNSRFGGNKPILITIL